MRPRVPSPFREPTDRGCWDKSLRICQGLCDHGVQRVRRIAHRTGLSKSRVPRLQQAMERHDGHLESWLWATADGRRWCTRLRGATRSLFGLQRGGGAETIRAFVVRRRLDTPVGCAPAA